MTESCAADIDNLHVVFKLGPQQYALEVEHVHSMVTIENLHVIPHVDRAMRGMMDLRGEAIALIDLRLRLGMTSLDEETETFCTILQARRQDHLDWLQELRSSITENRPFEGITDPTQCAFGRWYTQLDIENLSLKHMLDRLDKPHRRLHAIADQAISLRDKGQVEEAMALIHTSEQGDLGQLSKLMEQACTMARQSRREIAIVIAGEPAALAVDEVLAVEVLAENSTHAFEDQSTLGINTHYCTGISRRSEDDSMVTQLALSALVH